MYVRATMTTVAGATPIGAVIPAKSAVDNLGVGLPPRQDRLLPVLAGVEENRLFRL